VRVADANRHARERALTQDKSLVRPKAAHALRKTSSLVGSQGLKRNSHPDCAPFSRPSLKLDPLNAACRVQWLLPIGRTERQRNLGPNLEQQVGLDPEPFFAHVGYLVRDRLAPELGVNRALEINEPSNRPTRLAFGPELASCHTRACIRAGAEAASYGSMAIA
jgi:hypothetical protein